MGKTDSYKAFQNSDGVGKLVKKICKQFNIHCKKRNPTQFPSDPNAPPRAKTGFMLFCDEKRPALMKKLAGQPVSAVAKELGKAWKEVSSSEQAKYSKKQKQENQSEKQQ